MFRGTASVGATRRRFLATGLTSAGAGLLGGRLLAHAVVGRPDRLDDGAQVSASATRSGEVGGFRRDARYVALYGHPGAPVLGVLGEQGPAAAAERIGRLALPFAGLGRAVVPTFEILASVASSAAGVDGDYSNEFAVERFVPWIREAAAWNMHVVFDLQPGRSTFVDQAREYEPLWLHPHVSMALDPEWRVGPTERPGGGRIGTVGGAEVNATIDYLDGLVRAHDLPPKMLLVHQFTASMVTDKRRIRGTDHVHVVFQMDGWGSPAQKAGSYDRMVADLPAGATTGFKLFFDEDVPVLSPAAALDRTPVPVFVSYQ